MAQTDLIVRIRADAREAQEAFRQVGTGLQGIQRQTGAMGQSFGQARADVGNLTAQFNDIAVMLASGQSPLLLAIQQGSQISQVLGPMGARGAVQALGSAFMGLINPVTFITVGAIAGGATLLQWLMSAEEETKSFKDAVSDLESALKRVQQANDVYSLDGINALIDRYGVLNAQVLLLTERQRIFAAQSAAAVAQQAANAARQEITGGFFSSLVQSDNSQIASFLGVELSIVEDGFRRINPAVTEFRQALDDLANAEGLPAQADAAARMLDLLEGTDLVGSAFHGTLLDLQSASIALNVEAEGLQGWIGAAATGLTTMLNQLPGLRDLLGAAADEAERLGSGSYPDMARTGDYLGIARTMVGTNENTDRDAIMAYFQRGGVDLDPVAEAWCAAFVNATLKQAGFEGTNSNLARSFLRWGREVEGTPQVGDIGVLPRGNDPTFGHVGIVSGVNANGTVTILGGNQSDGVNEQTYAADQFLGFRRPDAFGEEAAADNRRLEEDARRAIEKAEAEARREADQTLDQAQREADRIRAGLRSDAEALASKRTELDQLVRAGTLTQAEANAELARYGDQLHNANAEVRAAEQVLQSIATPEEERARRIEELNKLLAAGTLTQEQYNRAVAALAAPEVATATAAIVDEYERMQEASEAGAARVGELFSSIVTGSMSAKEAVAQLIMELARAAIMGGFQQLGQAGGPMGALFGSLGNALGGPKAGGGPVWPGGAFLVGERGPEIFAPSGFGSIIPNHRMPSWEGAAAQAGGRVEADVRVFVDQDGNWRAEVARIGGAVADARVRASEAGLPGRVKEINRDPRAR